MLGDLAQAPRHGHAHAHADGLAEGLLGRKARGQVAHAALGPARAARLPGGELGRRSGSRAAKRSPWRSKRWPDAPHVADVGADAVDHARACQAGCACGDALRRYAVTVARVAQLQRVGDQAHGRSTPPARPGTARRKSRRLSRFRSWPALTPRPAACAARAASAYSRSTCVCARGAAGGRIAFGVELDAVGADGTRGRHGLGHRGP